MEERRLKKERERGKLRERKRERQREGDRERETERESERERAQRGKEDRERERKREREKERENRLENILSCRIKFFQIQIKGTMTCCIIGAFTPLPKDVVSQILLFLDDSGRQHPISSTCLSHILNDSNN
jgi:hypothetical protein